VVQYLNVITCSQRMRSGCHLSLLSPALLSRLCRLCSSTMCDDEIEDPPSLLILCCLPCFVQASPLGDKSWVESWSVRPRERRSNPSFRARMTP